MKGDYTGQLWVTEYLKGRGPRSLRISPDPSSCGTEFDNGATYLMYLYREEPLYGYTVNMCSPPAKITPVTKKAVGRDIAAIRQVLAQQPEPSATSPPTPPVATPTAAATALPPGGTGDDSAPGPSLPIVLAAAFAAATAAFGAAALTWRLRRR